MATVATVNGNLGNRDVGIDLLGQVIQDRRSILGENHPDTISAPSIHSAFLWSSERNWREYINYLEQEVAKLVSPLRLLLMGSG